MNDILDSDEVEQIHRRYIGSQIDLLCRSHEELRTRLEQLEKEIADDDTN
jgi:hypothetical protein